MILIFNKVLYFPNITLNKSTWLYRTLLYWDSIETITPERFLRDPELFENRSMIELLESELVKPIIPSMYLQEYPNFRKDFLDYVDNKYVPRVPKYKKIDDKITFTSKIHIEKLDSLGQDLADRELAYWKDDWLYLHKTLSRDFMYYLAIIIGQTIQSQPMTDSPYYINAKLPTIKSQQSRNTRDKLRIDLLKEVFPIPSGEIDIWDLRHFKDSYGHQLKSFRQFIERSLIEIESTPLNLREERLSLISQEIHEEKLSISSRMKGSGFSVNYASLFTVGSIASTILNGAQHNNELTVTSAVLSAGSLAANTLSSKRQRRKELMQNPLSYAFFVDQRIIKNRRMSYNNSV